MNNPSLEEKSRTIHNQLHTRGMSHSGFSQPADAGYYSAMSKQSEQILEEYKNRTHRDSKICLDESYESVKSGSNYMNSLSPKRLNTDS